MARSRKPWFAPKAFGYGAGLPISWEGWAALLAFVLGMLGAATLLDGLVRAAAAAGLIVAFVLIAAAKTEGGWRWRSGGRP